MLLKYDLLVTRDLGHCNRVRDKLEAAGIRTWVRTGSLGSIGRCHGVPGIHTDSTYEYKILVRQKDRDAAEELLRSPLSQLR